MKMRWASGNRRRQPRFVCKVKGCGRRLGSGQVDGRLPLVSGRRIDREVVDGGIPVKAVRDTFQVVVKKAVHFSE